MALINCYECGGTVSTTAKFCPHCGAPIEVASKKRVTPPPIPPMDNNHMRESGGLKPKDQKIVDEWVEYYSERERERIRNPWNLPFFIHPWRFK